MRYAKDRKAETRRSILVNACRRFAAQGFEDTSIDQIMRDCNLTRGGFYAHFKSKSELYRDSIALATAQRKLARRDGDDWIDALIDGYLFSDESAFYATDVASDEPEVRTAYARAFNELSSQIAAKMAALGSSSHDPSLALTVMLIGAIAVSRTIDEESLKRALVAACKDSARLILEGNRDALSFFWAPATPAERARV